LHKRLYTGILKDYYPPWLSEGNFSPHITVGSFKNKEDYDIAINDTKNINDTFRTIVTEITVEIIDQNENSIIESNISLK
jgi:2'-5' RNA ligase